MNCTHPNYILDLGLDNNTGKRRIKFLGLHPDISSFRALSVKYGSENIIPVPCGKCLDCKINYAKTWAVRCMLECYSYVNNWFVTLTYDDEHLPDNGKLQRKDVQLFLKLLRHYYPGIRYFGCGEYGSHTHRAHYHLILFNLPLDDVKCISKGRFGGFYYESKKLVDIWSKGNVTLGDVTFNSCDYVARYCTKKVFDDEDDSFVMMSTHPGLGTQYFLDNYEKIYDTDKIYLKGFVYRVPRYFDKLLERIDPSLFDKIKFERIKDVNVSRINALLSHNLEFDEQVYQYAEQVSINKFKDKLKRGGC